MIDPDFTLNAAALDAARTIRALNIALQKVSNSMGDTITLVGGQVLHNTHVARGCVGDHCPIHRPSFHHMREWHQFFGAQPDLLCEADAKVYVSGLPMKYMHRVCNHGVLHIDPDEPYWQRDDCPCDEVCKCCIPPNALTIVDLADRLSVNRRG